MKVITNNFYKLFQLCNFHDIQLCMYSVGVHRKAAFQAKQPINAVTHNLFFKVNCKLSQNSPVLYRMVYGHENQHVCWLLNVQRFDMASNLFVDCYFQACEFTI